MGWDTAFSVSGVAFPNDTVQERAVVSAGNNHRLHRFLAKCRAGGEVRVGFIGGSITRGAIATADENRYSSTFCRFLGNLFPGARVVELNAGIGATDSRFGASRLRDDLLADGPDLVVIEFAVNDDFADSSTSAESIESLIRQSLRDPELPVLLFQTMNRSGHDINQRIQARIARHYGVPVIGYRSACWPLVEAGTIPWAGLSRDDVHPNDDGHLIAGYLLFGFVHGVAMRTAQGPDAALPVPASLSGGFFDEAGIYKADGPALALSGNAGWSVMPDGKGRAGFLSRNAGDRIAFATRTREMTLMYLHTASLDSEVEVRVDGAPVDTLSAHFPQDWGGGYLKSARVIRDAARREHTVEIVNLNGGEFDLRFVLFGG